MKKYILPLSLLALTACSNVNQTLPEGKTNTFTTESKNIVLKGNEGTNAFNLAVENKSDSIIFINWSNAKVINKNDTFTGLYDLSNVNNNVWNQQENILKPNQTIVGKFAPLANLKISQNEAVDDYLKPYVWGSKDLDTKEDVNIEVPVYIGGFDGTLNVLKLNIKK